MFLSVLQVVNYIFPLITFTYLVRVLGVEKFGLLSFAQSFIQYFIVITDYGFHLSATREISIHRDNKEKVNEIFSSVMIIKSGLFVISFMIMSGIVFGFEKFRREWLLYYLTFGMVLGQVLFPVWFFQGIEDMKWITYLNITTKGLFTVAVFLCVKDSSHYIYVPLLNFIGLTLMGVLSLYLVLSKYNVNFDIKNIRKINNYLIEGWNIFLSRVYVSIYNDINIFFLGLFGGNTMVGYYSITTRIVLAIGGLFEPLNQALFPYLAKKYKENFLEFVKIFKRIIKIFLIISFSLLLLSQHFKSKILYFLTANNDREILYLLNVFLYRIIFYPFGPLLSNILIIMKKKEEFIKVMNYTVLFNFIVVVPSIYLYKAKGLVYSFILLLTIHIFLLIKYVRSAIEKENLKNIQ
ncbi:MAG: oligosaccharide flippase family protein [Nitrososphaerota archaeon]